MAETLDQVFVILKHWLVGLAPSAYQPVFSALLSILPILLAFPLLFAVTTILERKGLGRIQNRYGPNRVGLTIGVVLDFNIAAQEFLQIGLHRPAI